MPVKWKIFFGFNILIALAALILLVVLAITFLDESITLRERWGIAVSVLAVVALCYERPAATKPFAAVILVGLTISGEAICRAFSI